MSICLSSSKAAGKFKQCSAICSRLNLLLTFPCDGSGTWHGTKRVGTAWPSMARHSLTKHGTAWHGVVQFIMAQHGTARHNTAWQTRHGTAQHGMVWHGVVQLSIAWPSMARHDLAKHGMAWHGKAWRGVVQLIMAQQGTAWHTLPALVPPPELSLQPHSMQQISEPSAASEKPPKL